MMMMMMMMRRFVKRNRLSVIIIDCRRSPATYGRCYISYAPFVSVDSCDFQCPVIFAFCCSRYFNFSVLFEQVSKKFIHSATEIEHVLQRENIAE